MKNAYSDSELFVLAADGGKYGSISRVGDVYVGREAAEAALKEIKEDAAKKNYTIGLEYSPMTLDDYIDAERSDANRDGYREGEASAGCEHCR